MTEPREILECIVRAIFIDMMHGENSDIHRIASFARWHTTASQHELSISGMAAFPADMFVSAVTHIPRQIVEPVIFPIFIDMMNYENSEIFFTAKIAGPIDRRPFHDIFVDKLTAFPVGMPYTKPLRTEPDVGTLATAERFAALRIGQFRWLFIGLLPTGGTDYRPARFARFTLALCRTIMLRRETQLRFFSCEFFPAKITYNRFYGPILEMDVLNVNIYASENVLGRGFEPP